MGDDMKKIIIKSLLALILIAAFVVSFLRISESAKAFAALPVIVIDAGHGGMDSGTVGEDGTLEKDINLDMALRLYDKFAGAGYSVYMTRTDDFDGQGWDVYNKNADMSKRVELINSYENAVVISVHQNSFTNETLSGAQVFYSSNNEKSSYLAECIRQSICQRLQPMNERAVKEGNDLSRILCEANPPAVIVECGFMSNKEELEKLKDETYREGMAYAIFMGTLNYLKG